MKKSIIIIGIFSTGVIVFFTLFIIQSSNLVGTESYEISAELSNADGIIRETTVKIAGVDVGKVKELLLQTDNHVLLTIELDGKVSIPIDSTIQKKPLGILGSSFLEIVPGTAQINISEGGTLQSTNEASLIDTLGDSAGSISEDIESITDTVDTYLKQSDILEKIDSIASELNTTVIYMNTLLETVQKSVENNTTSIGAIITATAQITNALEYLIVQDKQSSNDDLSQTLLAIRNTLVNIEEITGKINNGEGTIGKLINDEELYDNINETASKLDTAVDSINKVVNPAAQLTTTLDYRVENLISENAQYTPKQHVNLQFAIPSTYREYKVGIAYGGGENLTDNTSYPSLSDSNIKLNLTIGQGVYKDYIVLHGGVIENTGGFRVDIRPIKEWEISSEVYNFGTQNGANIRAFTQVKPFIYLENKKNPLSWLYVNGGVDDILNSYTRTYFVGIGLHLVDNFFHEATTVLPVANTIQQLP